VPNAVVALTLQGQDSLCGCPFMGLHGGAMTAPIDPPPTAADLYTPQEWSDFARQVSEVINNTHTPLCPCLFSIVGFICCAIFNGSNRMQGLTDIVQRENARLSPQGLQWVLTPQRGTTLMALAWLPTRIAWEAANPHRRAVSREPPLAEFQQIAAAILSMGPAPAQQQMQMQMVAQGPPQQQVIMVGQPQPMVVMQGPPQPIYVQQQPQMGQPQYVQQPQYAQNGQPQYAPQGAQPQYVQQNGQPQYSQGPPQYSQQPYSPQPQIHSPSGPQFGANGQPVYR
jgi:hypothetical protein